MSNKKGEKSIMRLNHKQMRQFVKKFEIKAKSIIMIDKGNRVTIIMNVTKIFDVDKNLVKEFFEK